MRHIRKPIFSLGLLLIVLVISAAFSSDDPTNIPDPSFGDALWIAESGDVLKVAIADGTTLFAINHVDEIYALAVDSEVGTIWASSGSTLYAYNFAGERLSATPIDKMWDEKGVVDTDDEGKDKSKPVKDNRNKKFIQLAVNPDDGSVWLSRHKKLYHFDALGKLIDVLSLPKKVEALTFDTIRNHLWVATQKFLTVYDASGTPINSISPAGAKHIRHMVYDEGADALWVAIDKNILRRYDVNTPRAEFEISIFNEIIALTSDYQDGLWVVAGKHLLKVDATGEETFRLKPFSGKGDKKAIDIACDPVDGSVWVASKEAIYLISAEGEIQSEFSLISGKKKPKIHALALYADVMPPQLEIIQPQEGNLLNRNPPAIKFRYDDAGIGVDTTTLALKMNGEFLEVSCDFQERNASCIPDSPLLEGVNTLRVVIGDFHGNISFPASVEFTIDSLSPVIIFQLPAGGVITNSQSFTLSGQLSEPATLDVDGVSLAVMDDLSFNHHVMLIDGLNRLTFTATDAAGNTSTAVAQVTLDIMPPPSPDVSLILVNLSNNDTITVSGQAGSVEGGAQVTLTNTRTGESVAVFADLTGGFDAQLAAQANDHIQIQTTDAAGNNSEQQTLTVSQVDGMVPLDPATIAPPLNVTGITSFMKATAFLYAGVNPIQTGVVQGAIEPQRAAVIRGQVKDRENNPLSGVTITLKDHPEVGRTFTRKDGMFDFAVNGGGLLSINYQKAGYLPVQRHVNVSWQDFAFADDVVMVKLDPKATTVTLSANMPMQAARGSVIVDDDGSRQATILFPEGTHASMVLPDGTSQVLPTLTVRLTEYTVGKNGPQAMPALLPPTSGYTYAVELSADEAIAAGAFQIDFDQPLPFYVDNFLDFPTGGIVPVGWYNQRRGAWIPSHNGRIVKILGIDTRGQAQLDIDGSGSPANINQLSELGITDAELRQLARLYPVGNSLWRVPIHHFTPWDYNWPYGPPEDAKPPPEEEPETDNEDQPDSENSDECKGCIIEPQRQNLGEEIPLAGTPFKLHYRSDRMPGYRAGYSVRIPITDDAVPSSLERVDLKVDIAGRRFKYAFEPIPNQTHTFVWDGQDVYGRSVRGMRKVRININYVYNAVYYPPNKFSRAFASVSSLVGSNNQIGSSRSAGKVVLGKTWYKKLGAFTPSAIGLGGWTITVHDAYDISNKVLYKGNGNIRSAKNLGNIITTYARNKNESSTFLGEGNLAIKANIFLPTDLAFSPDGTLYITVRHQFGKLLRIAPEGNVTNVNFPVALSYLSSVAVGPDGSLYVVDVDNFRVLRIGVDGGVSIAAGNGTAGLSGTGSLATQAMMRPFEIALDADGNLYIAEPKNNVIRRVGPDGLITLVAGSGSRGFSGDGGLATQARLNHPNDLAIGPDGNLYIADYNNHRIRRVSPNGIITTIAGNGGRGYGGDGGPATQAMLRNPQGITVASDSSLYIADRRNHRIRKVSPEGIITTVAGNGILGYDGDGGISTGARLNLPIAVAFSPDENLYIADYYNHRIRRVVPPLPGFTLENMMVASNSGALVYMFNNEGYHQSTVDTVTEVPIYKFIYDARGNLVEIEDRNSDITRIERNNNGDPMAIVSPDGQRTALVLSANGYLASVTNPNSETYQMEYTAGGLMTQFTDPRNNVSQYKYDRVGRLLQDTNASESGWTLTRSGNQDSYTISMISSEGRTAHFTTKLLANGDRLQINTYPNNTIQEKFFKANGEEVIIASDGTVTMVVKTPDSRFGMQAPIAALKTVTMPSGLRSIVETKRSATLKDENNLLSLISLTEEVILNNKIYTSTYNPLTFTWNNTTPEGRQSSAIFDKKGRLINIQSGGLAATNYIYDSSGRLLKATIGEGDKTRTTRIRYYSDGLQKGYIERITNALGHSTHFEYDLAGRVIKQIFSEGREVSFNYNRSGNLIHITPPEQSTHQFEYTPIDQIAEYTPPDTTQGELSTHYQYNQDRQLTRITRPSGQTVEFSYDSGGELDNLNIPRGYYRYSYDSVTGQISTINAPGDSELEYAYDGFLPTSTAWVGEIFGSLTQRYNDDFQVTELAVNGEPIFFSYDRDGLLTQAGVLTLDRDVHNGLLIGTTLGAVSTVQSYNDFGELKTKRASYEGVTFYEVRYMRDKLGRIAEKTERVDGMSNTYIYNYDFSGRLVDVEKNGASTSIYKYDANGNRIYHNGTIANYDAQDRLLRYGNVAYIYTANGELNTKTENRVEAEYTHGVLGNLVKVKLRNDIIINYLIDGQNRRIGKKVNGKLVQGFLYQDQFNPVAELDGSGNVVARFIYADKPNVPAYMIKDGKTYRIISDHLGSPRVVIDIQNGVIYQRMDYDEFGQVVRDTNPGFQPFGFAGGIYDQHTGLVRFGARDYDSEIGRWVAKDPILFASRSTNLYAYALNDPVNFIDPDGQLILNVISGAVGATIGAYNAHASGGSGNDIVGGALIGGLSNAVSGKALINALINAAGNIAGQTTNPCFSGNINAAEAAMAGLLGSYGIRDRLPQFMQPNLAGPLPVQIAHESVAEAGSQMLGSNLSATMGRLF
ncbi:RHS repeat-associated core domain-containing protein [Nitrosococcus wardiae]|uniref:Uncharacterized protein n=1 Tax=Nitrosococcus wardiae TaxID=1814290 RepID=A0A4V1AW44_9GAMM|nr:RHS repeat-associated core domain-containing protein [Nitrosococcus wardiae]QBQ55345.1 hypothetical protein E3U44_13120 [Nitrosococcus wardiae]